MNEQTARQVCDWLTGLGHADVRPVRVTFTYKEKTATYYGASYQWVGHYAADMQACREGKAKPGEEYRCPRYYLVGKLPPSSREKIRMYDGIYEHKNVYRIAGDEGDWYISGYAEQPIKPDVARFHPFGPNFQLGRWPHEDFGQRIDHYDPKPGQRVRLPALVAPITQESA